MGIYNQIVVATGLASDLGGGFRVTATLGKPIITQVSGSWFVAYNLTKAEQQSVSLSLFRRLITKHETAQSGALLNFAHSNFSIEDLPSNLIGFYRAVVGATDTNIRDACHVLGPRNSCRAWDEAMIGDHLPTGTPNSWIKDTYWQPKLYHSLSPTAAKVCKKDPKAWPTQFSSITEAKQGSLWRDWVVHATGYKGSDADELIQQPDFFPSGG